MQTIINDFRASQLKNLLNTGEVEELQESNLNPQQEDAVNCKSRIIYVNAGPGTGKTHLLTNKILEYIRTSNAPERIVALSYTNTAANHIGDKLKEVAENASIEKEYTIYYGTIHSFCYSMMSSYNSSVHNQVEHTLLDDEDLHELAEEINIYHGGGYMVKDIEACLGNQNANSRVAQIVKEYKERYKLMTVNDILTKFIDVLDTDSDFRQWIKGQVTAIAVDEAQDMSATNYVILDKLLGINPKMKLFIVGDPRQNIFEFNGGSYKNLEDFLSRHEQHSTKHLTITYRCGQNIADYVNGFSFTDCDNTQLQSMCKESGHIKVIRSNNVTEEAAMVYEEIVKIGNLKDTAVLCNNLKYMDRLMNILNQHKVPYRVLGGRKILKPHVKLIKHLLRIVEGDNEYSMQKILEAARLTFKKSDAEQPSTYKERFYVTDIGKKIRVIKEQYSPSEHKAFQIMECIITQIMRKPKEGSILADDYNKLLGLSMQYDTLSDFLLAFAVDKEAFADFLQKDYEECQYPSDNDEHLVLSTIHSAKGLEWRNVFVMGLSEGNFPNSYFCYGKPQDLQDQYFNNELKKMYVASTRAKENLYLTYSSLLTRKGYTFVKKPSRFITNLINPQHHESL